MMDNKKQNIAIKIRDAVKKLNKLIKEAEKAGLQIICNEKSTLFDKNQDTVRLSIFERIEY
ncbi:MAG: hypothetical protein A2V66_16875 [Ignavibacteria bacterium RBG_13_36_8]|nr:MAG: hypothetical protein A2V66_16875 [Ignavibacteria bacterium RBG_13_36_8]